MSEAREVLELVLETFEDPARWTKGTLCQGSDGRGEALSCCLVGGVLLACVVPASPLAALKALRAAVAARGFAASPGAVSDFNDAPDTTIEDVRAVLREAISLA